MIWSKSRAITVNNGENVSTNIVDVMHSAQLVVEEQQQQQQTNLLPLVRSSHLVQQLASATNQRLLIVCEVYQKSSINEAYYNLDKVLSWSAPKFCATRKAAIENHNTKKKKVR